MADQNAIFQNALYVGNNFIGILYGACAVFIMFERRGASRTDPTVYTVQACS